MITAAYVAAVLIGLLIAGHVAIAWYMRRIRRAISPEAAEFRRRLAGTPFPDPTGGTR